MLINTVQTKDKNSCAYLRLADFRIRFSAKAVTIVISGYELALTRDSTRLVNSTNDVLASDDDNGEGK